MGLERRRVDAARVDHASRALETALDRRLRSRSTHTPRDRRSNRARTGVRRRDRSMVVIGGEFKIFKPLTPPTPTDGARRDETTGAGDVCGSIG
tara:strand:- start:11385 stop:11666 length:282 start_codon:yes stop_codon:yes gene_type:complete